MIQKTTRVFLNRKSFQDGVPGVVINKMCSPVNLSDIINGCFGKVYYSCNTEMLHSSPVEVSNHCGWDFASPRKQGF